MDEYTNIGYFNEEKVLRLNIADEVDALPNMVAKHNGHFFRNLTFFLTKEKLVHIKKPEGISSKKLSRKLSLKISVQLALQIFENMKTSSRDAYLKIDIKKNFESILKPGFFEKIFGFVPKYKQELRVKVEQMIETQNQLKLESVKETIYNQIEDITYKEKLKKIFADNEIKTQLAEFKTSFKKFRDSSKSPVNNEQQITSIKNEKDSLLTAISNKMQNDLDDQSQLKALLFLSVIDTSTLNNIEKDSSDIDETIIRTEDQKLDCYSAEAIFPRSLDIIKKALGAGEK